MILTCEDVGCPCVENKVETMPEKCPQVDDVGPGLTDGEKVELGMGDCLDVLNRYLLVTREEVEEIAEVGRKEVHRVRLKLIAADSRISKLEAESETWRKRHSEAVENTIRIGLLREKDLLRIEMLEAALKAVEWGGCDRDGERGYCDACAADEHDGHKPGCVVGEALK